MSPINPAIDMCVCTHSRAVHGPFDGHGACEYKSPIPTKEGWTRQCPCEQFTWSHFKED